MAENKRLFLIRHAKSSWQDPGLADHDRPLNQRGQRDAPLMGKRLAQKPETPRRIISSPALRALTTAEIIAAALGLSRQAVVIEETIYGATPRDLLELIQGFDDRCDRVALVGHNPTFTDLLNRLVGGGIGHMPTCSIATIGFEAPRWRQVVGSSTRLIEFDYPRKAD